MTLKLNPGSTTQLHVLHDSASRTTSTSRCRSWACNRSPGEQPQNQFQFTISPNHGTLNGIFEVPNFRRMPFWSYIWTQNFVNRQHLFNIHHSGYLAVCFFFWYCGALDTAPLERREKYYMNSAKFRMQTAYANPGTRPAARIAQEQAKVLSTRLLPSSNCHVDDIGLTRKHGDDDERPLFVKPNKP